MILQAGLRRGLPWPLLLGCLLLASACLNAEGQLSEPISQTPEGEFIHSGTQFKFLADIGDFHRVEVTQYDDSGKDVSVGYNLDSPDPITATVYVYPGRDVLNLGSDADVVAAAKDFLDEQEFEGTKDEVVAYIPGLTLVFEDESFAIINQGERMGRRAIFEGQGMMDGAAVVLRTEVDLFGFGDWFIKYRFTYLSESSTAPDMILGFMNSLQWPPD